MTIAVYGWGTKKTPAGFDWQVYQVEHARSVIILKTGTCPTRAKALRLAKGWVLFLRQNAQRAGDR